MTHELMNRMIRERVFGHPQGAPDALDLHRALATVESADEIADALIGIAARKWIEETRAW